MIAAYDDNEGVTAAFNLNALLELHEAKQRPEENTQPSRLTPQGP
jgi:uncharacterized SAM-dependent methyltransferase